MDNLYRSRLKFTEKVGIKPVWFIVICVGRQNLLQRRFYLSVGYLSVAASAWSMYIYCTTFTLHLGHFADAFIQIVRLDRRSPKQSHMWLCGRRHCYSMISIHICTPGIHTMPAQIIYFLVVSVLVHCQTVPDRMLWATPGFLLLLTGSELVLMQWMRK